ncbi:MAG TPA: ATP cone domain-containing protein [Verrucomicrobiae bacterium]|nr:ATP cone domain-containing protein [Verrucomicrobiae bacterium]
MILERQDLAWVESTDGRRTPFDVARLIASIQTAASRVGHDGEWLAQSVAGAIHLYARDCTSEQTVETSEIEDVVASVLHMLGYDDIERAYLQRRQLGEIRLDQLVAQSGPGFELNFFQRLDDALRSAEDEELALLRVRGLRSCVMRLRGAQRWGASCRALAEDIVEHVRFRVARARPQRAAELRLAVLD